MEIILHPVLEKKNLYNLPLIKEITMYYMIHTKQGILNVYLRISGEKCKIFARLKLGVLHFLHFTLTCKISKNDIFFIQKSKKFFCFSWGMKAYDPKFMIRFVLSAQQLTLQSSKVQNCQN